MLGVVVVVLGICLYCWVALPVRLRIHAPPVDGDSDDVTRNEDGESFGNGAKGSEKARNVNAGSDKRH